MQLYDAIDEMAGSCGRSIYSIQKDLNNSNTLATSKSRGSVLKADTLAKVANICGYSLALVPTDSLPRNAIEIVADQS